MHTESFSPAPPPARARAAPEPGGGAYRFGRFTLYPARKLLACGDCPVVLGGRAFDLLVALVMRAGDVVSHHDLVAAVWPHAVVEENGLRVHISALRKALGESPDDQYIVTVLGRGYRFVRQVSAGPCAHTPAPDPGWSPLPVLPAAGARSVRLLGREAAASELADCLARCALVTLAGPGGIGKSALALAHAARHAGQYADGVHVVDFAQAGDAAMAPVAIASVLGISLQQADPVIAISRALAGLQALLVFDNCEHVLPEAARFAERIMAAAPRVALLATSRAPLGLPGEAVLRLPPLALPEAPPPGVDQALAYPAIALFAERARANASQFALTPANLPQVVRLCQQLDGLPLAIELAAARVEALGVDGLLARIDDMFRLLTRSRRLANPRHAALEAVLDRSYRLLDVVERTVLRRLSVFHDGFVLESAVLVCAFDGLSAGAVRAAVAALAAKSLLALEPGPGTPYYRCLNITRRYAAARLAGSGEAHAVAWRHATHLRALLAQARAELDECALPHWRRRHGRLAADLLAALDWALGPGGEPQLGLLLCAAAPLPMFELGMVDQFRRRRVESCRAMTQCEPPKPARRPTGAVAGARREAQGDSPIYVFGAFRLLRQARQLCLGATPVRLGGRALELLLVLVERAGEVVSRAELERLIWPNSVVEDSCLRVHIGALRKALGEGADEARYIANVPGRGYSFVAPVALLGAGTALAAPGGARTLPLPLTRVLGRDEVLRQLREQLPRCRLATIVGHGGIGKTSVALCLASALQDAYADGACFVDLAPLSSGIQIPDALAACLGLDLAVSGAREALESWLASGRLLLVLDNCEHLIEDATALVERLLRIAPGIDIVATSREPLDADGECVHRLAPLACPPADPALSLEDALHYPALQLLASRLRAGKDSLCLGQAELQAAIALCQRVDGVPLAIEFAAAQVGLLGMQGAVEQLDDRLLDSGRRTVLPGHRTLRALLDWSYDLLSPAEQRVLRCCALFAGSFSLESALAVASGDDASALAVASGDDADVAPCVLALVSKSLVSADTRGPDARFVLLAITRAYAVDKLAQDPERSRVARRHARHMAALLEQCGQALGPGAGF